MGKFKKVLSLVLVVALVSSVNWSYIGELFSLTKAAAMECISGGSGAGAVLANELESLSVSKFFEFNVDDLLNDLWDSVKNDDGGSTESSTEDVAVDDTTKEDDSESDNDARRRLVNINDWDGDVNDPSVRLYGTYDELRNAGVKDGHHIVQDAAARDVPGYNKGDAPAIQADGPSTKIGSEHYNLTYDQSHATTGGTYGIEKNIGLNSLEKNLGLSSSDLGTISNYLDAYFCNTLGLTEDSPLRIPGNRHYIEN